MAIAATPRNAATGESASTVYFDSEASAREMFNATLGQTPGWSLDCAHVDTLPAGVEPITAEDLAPVIALGRLVAELGQAMGPDNGYEPNGYL